MSIDAPAFLARLQKQGSFNAELLELVPAGGGGSDLKNPPDDLVRQLEVLGCPRDLSYAEMLRWLMSREQIWGLPTYNSLIGQLSPERAAKLKLGPNLAIGSRKTAELNGRTYQVPPPGKGAAVLLDAGAGILAMVVAAAVVAAHPGGHRAILSTIATAALGVQEDAALVQRRLRLLGGIGAQSPLDCGLDLAYSIESYRLLGVIEPAKLVGMGFVPVRGDSARVGHPFAAASDLADVMERFLLCHELGHLEDDYSQPYTHEVEFSADRRGLRLMADAIKSDPIGLLGCFAALNVMFAMLEALESGALVDDDPHPAARERLDRLRQVLIHEYAAESAALDGFENLYQRTIRLWNGGCNVMRSTGWNGENAFDLHLESCVQKSNRAAWEDQIPRWFLFGSPRGLCRAAAESRVRLQAARDAATRSDDVTQIDKKLRLVEWVFEAIPPRAPEVGAHLMAAYDAARSQFHWSGRMTDPFGPLLRCGVELSDWADAYRSSEQLLRDSIVQEGEARTLIAGVRGVYYHVRWKDALSSLSMGVSAGALTVAASFSAGSVASDNISRTAACLSLVSVLAAIKNPAIKLSGDEGLICVTLSRTGPCSRDELRRRMAAELSIEEATGQLRVAAAVASLKALGCVEEYGGDRLILAETLWIWRPDVPLAPSLTANGNKSLKVLFLAADPFKKDALSLDEEVRGVTAAIQSGEHRNIALTSAWAVRPDDLQVLLLQHQPHVLHFSGHGTAASQLILVDEHGAPRSVTETVLKHLLTVLQDNVRLVVLNACHSESLADGLVEVIDCAVGMRGEIDDVAARKFAVALYRALAHGRSLQTAFDLGINSIKYDSLDAANVPKLCSKEGVDPSLVFLHVTGSMGTSA
jgi:hypothetical protein